jgi:hypothetical protein
MSSGTRFCRVIVLILLILYVFLGLVELTHRFLASIELLTSQTKQVTNGGCHD